MVAEQPSATTSGPATPQKRRRWLDLLGVLWVVGAACVALVPALRHGSYIGSYDTLSTYGLTTRHGLFLHNAAIGDQTNQIIPWITLAWTQVHQGHLPLWLFEWSRQAVLLAA